MTPLARPVLILAFAFNFSASAWAQNLPGLWTLKVEDRSHHVIANLDIKFTDQVARSCMSGDWFRVDVVSATTRDASFFPVSGPLSFNIENKSLTIGSTDICDAYLMLNGALNEKAIKGNYFGSGLGGDTPLGFFTLSRAKEN